MSGSERKLTELRKTHPNWGDVAQLYLDATAQEQRKDEALRRAPMPIRESILADDDWHEAYDEWWYSTASEDALAAVPVETQEAAEPDDYARPGWRMFPLF